VPLQLSPTFFPAAGTKGGPGSIPCMQAQIITLFMAKQPRAVAEANFFKIIKVLVA
jgi:hypothetical protein